MVDSLPFGKGIVTERKGLPGECQDCKNVYLGAIEGSPRVETRKRIKRLYATRAANAKILMLAELRAFDGTREVLFKSNGVLYDSANTSLKTGLSTTAIADICFGNDKAFITDTSNFVVAKDKSVFDLVKTNGGGSLNPTEAGVASGFGTGAQYTQKRIYRRMRDDNSWYLIAAIPTGSFPYIDTTLETDFLAAALSEVHNNTTGLANMEVPVTAVTCAFFRGRLFLGYKDSVRWSKIDLSFIFKSDGAATKRIGDDGDDTVRIISWNTSLIIFKRYSIWVMNGDVLEDGFTFYPATKTIGLLGRFALAATPQSIVFLGSDGRVWTFDLNQLNMISSQISISQTKSSADTFSAGWDRYQDCVYLTTDQASYMIFGKEFGLVEYAMNKVVPSVWGELTNSAGERKLYLGDTQGYIYETETSNSIDGVSSGTTSGTVTSATTSTLTDSSAVFNTTGNGLTGLSLTIGSVTYLIVSNTGTVITISGTFSPALAGGESYSIGSTYYLWHSSPIDHGSSRRKRLQRVVYTHRLVTGSITYGVTLERNTDLTAINKVKVATGLFRVVLAVRYRAFRFAIFFFGIDVVFDLVGLFVEPKGDRGIVE